MLKEQTHKNIRNFLRELVQNNLYDFRPSLSAKKNMWALRITPFQFQWLRSSSKSDSKFSTTRIYSFLSKSTLQNRPGYWINCSTVLRNNLDYQEISTNTNPINKKENPMTQPTPTKNNALKISLTICQLYSKCNQQNFSEIRAKTKK